MLLAEHLALPLGPIVVAVEHLRAVVVPLRVHLDLAARLVAHSLVFEPDGASLVSDPVEVLTRGWTP